MGVEEFTGTDRFAIRGRLGAGGMGVVYRAYDREREEEVALKTLPAVNPATLYRFKREFRSIADLMHPNLAVLYELFADEEQWFFTMELVPGADFATYVRHGVPVQATSGIYSTTLHFETLGETQELSEVTRGLDGSSAPASKHTPFELTSDQYARLQRSLAQLAEGVLAIHDAGKLHRDIKPSNVLVTPDGRVVLLDFGLVTEQSDSLVAEKREVAGTLAYMAPEQVTGQVATEASDWYSVGVTLYQTLTGRLLHTGDVRLQIELKRSFEPPPPHEFLPGIPEDLASLCADLVRRDPGARPAGRLVRQLLGEFTAHAPVSPPAPVEASLFVGREAHLAALRQALYVTRDGEPVTLYVHGRSGMGKSTLVQNFLQSLLVEPNTVVLAGRCFEQESVPYKAVDSLVDALQIYLHRLPSEERQAWMPPDMPALSRLFPVLSDFAPPAAAPARPQGEDQRQLRRRAFGAFRELLRRIGREKTLVLYIDDLQWGDLDSAALLTDLLRRPDAPRLLFLGVYRSEYAVTSACLAALLAAEAGSPGATPHREIRVEALQTEDAKRLARALLGESSASEEVIAAVASESKGIPYFVHELVLHVREGATLAPRADGAPLRLETALSERIARLPEEARDLLEIVAVAAQPLRQELAYTAAQLEGRSQSTLHALRAGHLIRTSGVSRLDDVETYHDRIRETVVSQLQEPARARRHLQLARTLDAAGDTDPERLATHFEGGGEKLRAGELYATAAEGASQALAFDHAAMLYRRSLDLRPLTGDAERAARAKLADALGNAGRGTEAAREFEKASTGADDAAWLERRRMAAYHYCASGHVDEGRAAFREVLGRVGMKMPKTPARALLSLVWRRLVLRLRGLAFHKQNAEQIPASELDRIDIVWAASTGLTMVDTIQGAHFETQHALLALRSGEPFRISRALAWHACHESNLGISAAGRAQEQLRIAQDLANELGDPRALAMVRMSGGIVDYFFGRWPSAVEALDDAQRTLREKCSGVSWERDTASTFALWSLAHLGEFGEIASRSRELFEEARERGDLYLETNLGTYMLPFARLSSDDPDGAFADIESSLGRWTSAGYHIQHITALMGRLHANLYMGAGMRAWELLQREWKPLVKSLFLRVQLTRIWMVQLRAHCNLAASAQSRDPKRFVSAARRDARSLAREKVGYAVASARLIDAGVAHLSGDASSLAVLEDAANRLEAAHMHLYAAAARRRLGMLLGGEAGERLVATADAWMSGRGIRNPSRITDMYTPGFSA